MDVEEKGESIGKTGARKEQVMGYLIPILSSVHIYNCNRVLLESCIHATDTAKKFAILTKME